jgi:hypothetical protein
MIGCDGANVGEHEVAIAPRLPEQESLREQQRNGVARRHLGFADHVRDLLIGRRKLVYADVIPNSHKSGMLSGGDFSPEFPAAR